jgi:Flp pilus assembly pilin Flp
MHATCDSGQTTSEYAVVLGLITLAIVVTIAGLSGTVVAIFDAAVAAFA